MALFVSSLARRRLDLEVSWFDASGRVVLSDLGRARQAVDRWPPGDGDGAGFSSSASLAAFDRLGEAVESLVGAYLRRVRADTFERALAHLERRFGSEAVEALLTVFAAEFGLAGPAASAERQAGAAAAAEPSPRARLLRRLLVFWLLDVNPAAEPIVAVLHAGRLREEPLYLPAISVLREFFAAEPAFPGGHSGLVETLLEPLRRAPGSLAEQLRLVSSLWRSLLGELADHLLRGADFVAEERAAGAAPGPGPARIPSYEGDWTEVRSFSPDRDWMPQLVLLAKNAPVWLWQLSKRFGRQIARLDQIPESVLDEIAASGFTGLWLIGVWERSPASRRIKRLCGNPEAIGSAYSLRGYRIASELGGDEALERLKERAAARGIRLAADMVPNHMGIDSDWVLAHPDWFVGLDHSPYPGYSFAGEDLSPDPSVGLYIEDHYYDRSDAAVVFRRLDRATGRERYVYHGNDGTGMPWNDTAQLDFLKPEVREAVIGTIVEVARRFPVIRFDAAMILTRRHFQRLWYPPPGSGGAIPSRAESGLSREDFAAAMPAEFWREVVERVAAEVPNTLLLAEAFWLMEGYFVRSLGMHRVYNSAFMNMLRDGETGKYRRLIKETLAFDPQILGRYVNFMSNPDERTAVDQFGDGDRYFGVCTLMSTLPGLPMFAHGQLAGLREKYGMEYARAYWDEGPDHALVARHGRQIAPLLGRRELFASVENFLLFDFTDDGGSVHEDVLAYSNGARDDRALVLFNNRDGVARGRLRQSAPYRPPGREEKQELVSRSLAQALGLTADGEAYLRFRDAVGGLEYLRRVPEVRGRGLEMELTAFEHRVLTDFRRLADDDGGTLARLTERIGIAGVPDLDRLRRHIWLEPLHDELRRSLPPSLLALLGGAPPDELRRLADDRPLRRLEDALERLTAASGRHLGIEAEWTAAAAAVRPRLLALVTLPVLCRSLSASRRPERRSAGRRALEALERRPEMMAGLFLGLGLDTLEGALAGEPERFVDGWGLLQPGVEGLVEAGVARPAAETLAAGLGVARRLRWGSSPAAPEADAAARLLAAALADEGARELLEVHSFEGLEWLSREGLEALLDLFLVLQAVVVSASSDPAPDGLARRVARWAGVVRELEEEAETAGYRVGRLLEQVGRNTTRE